MESSAAPRRRLPSKRHTVYAYWEEELHRQLAEWNKALIAKGIPPIPLRYQRKTAPIYVCRRSSLAFDLNRPGVAHFLSKYGYPKNDVEYSLNRLTFLCAERKMKKLVLRLSALVR